MTIFMNGISQSESSLEGTSWGGYYDELENK